MQTMNRYADIEGLCWFRRISLCWFRRIKVHIINDLDGYRRESDLNGSKREGWSTASIA